MGTTAWPAQIHWLTLGFSDLELEAKLVSSNFQSSYAVYMCLMVATTCVHIVLPWLVPNETTMSAIYLPSCFCVCATRVYVKRMADQHRAHDILCRVWVFNVFLCFSLHRWCLIIGLH